MVVEDNVPHGFIALHGAQNFMPQTRVLLNILVLIRGQIPILIQDRLGHAYFANVMH